MTNAIRQRVTVQPGGVIEVRSPELTAGARAEVIILLEEPQEPPRRSLRSIIGSGKGCFATPEEADAFLRQERDSWE